MQKKHIHWQDGMKVSKDHFLGMENAFRSDHLDAAASQLTSFSYGLLPQLNHSKSLDLFLKLDQSDEVVLNLLICHAITPGGAYISIDADSQHKPELRISQSNLLERIKTSQDGRLYVAVKINPYQRNKVGENLNGEDPPRQPFTESLVELHVATYEEISRTNVNGLSEVIVHSLLMKDDKVALDVEFIPPTYNVSGSSDLLRTVESWEEWFSGTLLNSLKDTLKAARANAKGTNDQQEIAHNVRLISKSLLKDTLHFISAAKRRREEPFLHTLNALQVMAGNFYAEWITLPGEGRSRLDNYFKEALKITEIESTVNNLWGAQYTHDRSSHAMKSAKEFIQLLSKLYDPDNGLSTKDFKWTEIEGEIKIVASKERRNSTID